MKRFRMIRGILCLAAALLAAVPAGGAEGAFEIADEGLELTETVSIYYPVLRSVCRILIIILNGN